MYPILTTDIILLVLKKKIILHKMSTLCMPISGGRFVNQVALMLHLLGCSYKPKRIISTSGGSIVAMIMTMAEYTRIVCKDSFKEYKRKVYDILDEINREWYMTPWCAYSVPNTLYGIPKGSVFNSGKFKDIINDTRINFDKSAEICFGTHCHTDGKQQLFSSKSKPSIPCATPLHLDQDKIIDAALASCSIPTIVPNVSINGKEYRDGGCSFASPLMCCYTSNTEIYKIVYISPARYETKTHIKSHKLEEEDIWNKTYEKTNGMITGSHVVDRNNGVTMVGADPNYKVGKGYKFLCRQLDIQKISSRSFIELIPINTIQVNFLTLTKGEATSAVRQSFYSGFIVKHWYK